MSSQHHADDLLPVLQYHKIQFHRIEIFVLSSLTMIQYTHTTAVVAAVVVLMVLPSVTEAFLSRHYSIRVSSLRAAPKRLEENVPGVLYVNEKVSYKHNYQ
jgi:hypothetical protein